MWQRLQLSRSSAERTPVPERAAGLRRQFAWLAAHDTRGMRVGCLRALVLRFLNNQRMSVDVTSITAIVVNGASPYWQVVTRRQGGAVTAVAAIQAFPTYQDRVGSLHIHRVQQGPLACDCQHWA